MRRYKFKTKYSGFYLGVFIEIEKDTEFEYDTNTRNALDVGDYIFHWSVFYKLFNDGIIEEIIEPNRNLILSDKQVDETKEEAYKSLIASCIKEDESVLDYNKKYNNYEAVHLMKNNDIKMIDSKFGHIWEYYKDYNTLWTDSIKEDGADHFIEDLFDEDFGYIDSLNLTFTLVKPQEEKVEKWVETKSRLELIKALMDKKSIRATKINDSHVKVIVYRDYDFDNFVEVYLGGLYNYYTFQYLEE